MYYNACGGLFLDRQAGNTGVFPFKNSSPRKSVYRCAHRHAQACTRKGVSVPSEGVASGKALSRHLEQRRKFPGLARDPSEGFPCLPTKGLAWCLASSELLQVGPLRARSRLCECLGTQPVHTHDDSE